MGDYGGVSTEGLLVCDCDVVSTEVLLCNFLFDSTEVLLIMCSYCCDSAIFIHVISYFVSCVCIKCTCTCLFV